MINESENNINSDIEPENDMESEPVMKQLIEMNLNEFINAIITEATTNDTIEPKLGDNFNIETCKKANIDHGFITTKP